MIIFNEKFESPDNSLRESIEKFVQSQETSYYDVVCDARVYLEVLQSDPDAIGFFEVIAEAVDVPVGEVIEFFRSIDYPTE